MLGDERAEEVRRGLVEIIDGLEPDADRRTRTCTIMVGMTGIREEVPESTADLGLGFTGSALPGVQLHFDLRYQEATSGTKDGLRVNAGFRVGF